MGDLFFATDTNQWYLYDGTDFKVIPLPLETDDQTGVNIGTQDTFVTKYNPDYITDVGIFNGNIGGMVVVDTNRTADGMLRSVEVEGAVQLQYYTDGAWRAILTGIQLQEDTSVLEFQPFGTDYWIETHTGNSNVKGLNGRPFIQAYEIDIGANPIRRIFSGKYFDGTNFVEW